MCATWQRNAGMTNVLRTYGKLPAVFTTLGDVGKSVAAVNLGRFIFGALLSGTGAAWQNPLDPVCGAYLAAIFCMIGHSRPIFFGFKGGKGVLVGAGRGSRHRTPRLRRAAGHLPD